MTPDETASHIAGELGEAGRSQRWQIAQIVQHLGADRALELLAKTHEIEDAGGMLVTSGKRRRTPGGVFFHLAHEQAPELARVIHQREDMRKKRQAEASAVLRASAAARGLPIASATTDVKINQPAIHQPVMPVEDTNQVRIRTSEKGSTATVKITLIGRPTRIIDKGDYIKLSMQSAPTPPALPKGLPTPAALATTYIVCIAAKQWRQVAEAARDPEDVLIVEGWPQINAQAGNVAVFATSVSTKKLQAAKRSAQLAGAGAGK
jgi:hypothetical protein